MTAQAESASPRFDRVQVEMLECVYQHRLLSTAQLHALYRHGLALRRTQRALAAMERVGWLSSVRQPGGMKLWFVTDAGADAVEAIPNRAELRRKVIPPEQAAGPLQQHTLAVNEVGVAFARAARERGDEFGPLAWRNEIAHPIGPPPGRRKSEMLIADAVLSYERYASDDSVYFERAFLELDRATMSVEALVAKLGRYLRLHDYTGPPDPRRVGLAPLWEAHYRYFPHVLVVLANGSRKRLADRRWLVQGLWEANHQERARRIKLHVCLFEDLIEHGPFAPIFKGNHEPKQLVDWTGRAPDQLDGEPAPAVPEPADEPEASAGADQWGRW
jgi:hypothetical protein